MTPAHMQASKIQWTTTAKPIPASPAIWQGSGGFCAAQRGAGKDQHDLRRQSRSGIEGAPSTALFGTANGRMKKGKRVTLFEKSNCEAGFNGG